MATKKEKTLKLFLSETTGPEFQYNLAEMFLW